MEKNDTVQYIGCSDEQVRWGNNDDPRSYLIVGKEYIVEEVDVHSQHTKIKLYNKVGWFNSVCFKEVNNSSPSNTKMKPSDIELESTVKLFEYEKLSREIEECNDIETLKNMLRCYIKLHMKEQEVITKMMGKK